MELEDISFYYQETDRHSLLNLILLILGGCLIQYWQPVHWTDFKFFVFLLGFEVEFNFLSTVMESSDGLYAAAKGLGIDLQIFFSYSPELTNEVMINCIKSTAILTRGLYAKMPDSVTLAESFLTQFPGINSLTAHSILSLGVTLHEFLAWSHEQRIHVFLIIVNWSLNFDQRDVITFN
jgi:hypothetical protein